MHTYQKKDDKQGNRPVAHHAPGLAQKGNHPGGIIQGMRVNPGSLTHTDVMALQRAIGNQAVGRLIGVLNNLADKNAVQKKGNVKERIGFGDYGTKDITDSKKVVQRTVKDKAEEKPDEILTITDKRDTFKAIQHQWKIDAVASQGLWNDFNVYYSVQKPGGSTQSCGAKVWVGGTVYEGKYSGTTHGEMDALNTAGQFPSLAGVWAIAISSPPCPRCAVVLYRKGAASQVYLPAEKKELSHMGQGWTYPPGDDELFKVIAPAKYRYNCLKSHLVSNFKNGTWNYCPF